MGPPSSSETTRSTATSTVESATTISARNIGTGSRPGPGFMPTSIVSYAEEASGETGFTSENAVSTRRAVVSTTTPLPRRTTSSPATLCTITTDGASTSFATAGRGVAAKVGTGAGVSEGVGVASRVAVGSGVVPSPGISSAVCSQASISTAARSNAVNDARRGVTRTGERALSMALDASAGAGLRPLAPLVEAPQRARHACSRVCSRPIHAQ